MEKYIIDERTGLRYELMGDYYLIAGEDEPEELQPIGVWGQRHLRYLKKYHRVVYANLLTGGKMNSYLADIDRQAQDMFEQLVKQIAKCEGVTEQLKSADQMGGVHRMNQIQNQAMDIVHSTILFA